MLLVGIGLDLHINRKTIFCTKRSNVSRCCSVCSEANTLLEENNVSSLNCNRIRLRTFTQTFDYILLIYFAVFLN